MMMMMCTKWKLHSTHYGIGALLNCCSRKKKTLAFEMTQIFDRDQIVREFALTFIANTQKKSIRVYARKLWYHNCTQASHNRLKHWFNLRKKSEHEKWKSFGTIRKTAIS